MSSMDEEIATVQQPEDASTNDEIGKILTPLEEAIRLWSGGLKKVTGKSGPNFPAPSRDLRNSTDFVFSVCRQEYSVRTVKTRFIPSAKSVLKWLLAENLTTWLTSLGSEEFFRRKSASNLLKTIRYALIPIAMDVGRSPDGINLLTDFLNCLDRYFENFMEFWTITDLDDEFLDQIPFVPESNFFEAIKGLILAYIQEKSSGEESSFEIPRPKFETRAIFDCLERCHSALAVLYANFEEARKFENDHPIFETVQELVDALELLEDRIKTLQFCKGDEIPPVYSSEAYFELCKDVLTEMPSFYLSATKHLLLHLDALTAKIRVHFQVAAPDLARNSDFGDFPTLKDADLACPLRCKATKRDQIVKVMENWRDYWAVAKIEVENPSENVPNNSASDDDNEEAGASDDEVEETSKNTAALEVTAIAKGLKSLIFCLNRFTSRREEYDMEPEPEPVSQKVDSPLQDELENDDQENGPETTKHEENGGSSISDSENSAEFAHHNETTTTRVHGNDSKSTVIRAVARKGGGSFKLS